MGLRQDVARTASEVAGAWRLVYQSYLRSGLIDTNAHEMYWPGSVATHATAVVLGTIGPLTVTTLTAIVDLGQGLPMDATFARELALMRSPGRKLMQVGLFADRRQLLSRCDEALLDLMRMAYYFGIHMAVTDLVVSVRPEHAAFYGRAFGLHHVSDVRTDPTIHDAPVVMLHGRLGQDDLCPSSPALAYFRDNPIEADVFAGRFSFEAEAMQGSALAAMSHEQRPVLPRTRLTGS